MFMNIPVWSRKCIHVHVHKCMPSHERPSNTETDSGLTTYLSQLKAWNVNKWGARSLSERARVQSRREATTTCLILPTGSWFAQARRTARGPSSASGKLQEFSVHSENDSESERDCHKCPCVATDVLAIDICAATGFSRLVGISTRYCTDVCRGSWTTTTTTKRTLRSERDRIN